jgi:hypothetical protein
METDPAKNTKTKRQAIILPGFIFIGIYGVIKYLLNISELICVMQLIVILK